MISKSQFVIFSALLAYQGMVEGMFENGYASRPKFPEDSSKPGAAPAPSAANTKVNRWAARATVQDLEKRHKVKMAEISSTAKDLYEAKSTPADPTDVAAAKAEVATKTAVRDQAKQDFEAEMQRVKNAANIAALEQKKDKAKNEYMTKAITEGSISGGTSGGKAIDDSALASRKSAMDEEMMKQLFANLSQATLDLEKANTELSQKLAEDQGIVASKAKLAVAEADLKKAQQALEKVTAPVISGDQLKALKTKHAAAEAEEKKILAELQTARAELKNLLAKEAEAPKPAAAPAPEQEKKPTTAVPVPSVATAEAVPSVAAAEAAHAVSVPKFTAMKSEDIKKDVEELVKKVADSDKKEATKIFTETFGYFGRGEQLQKNLDKILKERDELAKKADEKAKKNTEKDAKKDGKSKSKRRLGGEEAAPAAETVVDPLIDVIEVNTREALASLAQLQKTHGDKFQTVTKDNYAAFKADAKKTGEAISKAEAVIKLREDTTAKAADLKKAKATVLGLGLGLGLGIPVLAAVVFTVLVKTNRVLLNFGSSATVSADV